MKPSTYLPNVRNSATAHQRASSTGVADAKTITLGSMTSAILISVETTNARVTFDGSDPTAASAPSLIFPKDLSPVLVPVGAGTVVKHCAATAAASVMQVTELI